MIYRLFLVICMVCLVGCNAAQTDDPYDPRASTYFQLSDKLIDVDGLTMRYRDEGPKEARTLVMIHGFTSSLESWDQLAAELSSDYRVIRMDLPGHGLTGPDEQGRYSNEQTVQFVSSFIDQLGLEDPILVGNSLGGLTAWRYASSQSDSVASLILIAPGGFSINGVTEQPAKVPAMVKFYLTKAPEAGVKQALSALYGNPEAIPVERFTSFRNLMKRPGNGEAFVQRAATFTLPDPEPELKRLDVPTLLLWGDSDIMVPSEHGEKFSAALPDAKLIVYDGVGHIPQEEIPGRVAADIHRFLEEHTP